MEPLLSSGDLVAGRRYFQDDFASLANQHCIIQLKPGDIMVRKIMPQSAEVWTLTCLNPQSTAPSIQTTTHDILLMAPVLWIRKQLNNN